MKGLFTGISCLLLVLSASAIRTADVHFTATAVTVDGVLNEASWATADSLTAYAAPWGDSVRLRPSCVKLLWDADNFYLGAQISDSNIVQTVDSGTVIDGDDMLEIHIAPDVHNSQIFVLSADWDTSNAQYFFILEFNLHPIFRSHFREAKPNGKNLWFASWDIASVQTRVVK
ncbi:MAG: sugar-binding protein, partial [Fibrobacterota bacterium]